MNNAYLGLIRQAQRGFDMDYCVSLGFDNINSQETGERRFPAAKGYGVDHLRVVEGLGCKAIHVTEPDQIASCSAAGQQPRPRAQGARDGRGLLGKDHQHRNGHRDRQIVEFNDLCPLARLTSGGRAAYRLASEPIGRLRRRAQPRLLCRTRIAIAVTRFSNGATVVAEFTRRAMPGPEIEMAVIVGASSPAPRTPHAEFLFPLVQGVAPGPAQSTASRISTSGVVCVFSVEAGMPCASIAQARRRWEALHEKRLTQSRAMRISSPTSVNMRTACRLCHLSDIYSHVVVEDCHILAVSPASLHQFSQMRSRPRRQ